jgi:four helix bundle protein
MAGKGEKLFVCQKAEKLVLLIYQVMAKFPREEMFGLAVQMRQAAISVPANIIEGASRYYKKACNLKR